MVVIIINSKQKYSFFKFSYYLRNFMGEQQDLTKYELSLFHSKYIEYEPGSLNVILSVPHGGLSKPKSFPDRDAGRFVDGKIIYDHVTPKDPKAKVKNKCDLNTLDLARALSAAIERYCGKKPHLVINHLHRIKLDCNCDCEEATFGVPQAVEAWNTFHQSINIAKSRFENRGIIFDLHGHAHPEKWIELGYGISGRKLDSGSYSASDCTIRHLCEHSQISASELICGQTSLGGLLASEADLQVIPSPRYKGPNRKNYFSGGYNVLRHGSIHSGVIDAIQIESPADKRLPDMIDSYADFLGRAICKFVNIHYST